jgi:hypothetical protein
MARFGAAKAVSAIAVLVLLGAACGSDDDDKGSSGTCDSVCSCVVSSGGDGQLCQSECASVVSAGGNVKAGCEMRLDGFGFPQCKPKCEGFPTGG